jgi:anti-anti-sigma factor
MRTNLRISDTTEGDITTLAVAGELDEAGCPELADRLAGHCRPGARIVLDLRPLSFMDSAGMELIHRAYVRSSLEGWTFAVMTSGERYIARRRVAA